MSRIGGIRRGWREFRQTIMWRLIVRQKPWMVALIVTAIGTFGGAVATLDNIRKLVDEGVIDQTKPVSDFVAALIFLAIWTCAFGIALRQVISRIGFHLEFELRIWLYERLQSSDPERLDALATGQMVTRAMTDLLLLEIVVGVLPAVAVVTMILAGIAALMLAIHPWLSLIAFTVLPINLLIVMRIRRQLWGMSWVALDKRARVTTAIDEAVRGARVVKAFGRERHEQDRLKQTARDAYAVAMTRTRLVARFDLLLNALPAVVMSVLVFFGTREGVAGRVTVGDLLLFFVFSLVFADFARSFGAIQSAWQFAKTGAGRIFELIAFAKPAAHHGGRALPPTTTDGLRIDHATVSISDHPVLDGVTLEARPGQLVVVAGPPRSGKTTLAKLIAGARTPTDPSSVTLEGIPLDDVDPVILRRAVRTVDEDPFLFGRSVRDNLLLGTDRPTPDAELWKALTAAGARQVVEELPQGLDTMLGDRGLTVSGGQRQRLALACALVVPPRVLVLDDALSAVDPALEMAILQRIKEHAPQTAVVAITRRPSAATVADSTVTLPPPAPGAPRRPRATGSLATDGPYDLLLAGIVAQLPPNLDEPVATDAEATEDEVPTVRGVLRPHRHHVRTAAWLLLGFTFVGLVPTFMTQVALDAVDAQDSANGTIAALGTLAAAAFVALLSYGFRIEAKKVEEGSGYLLRRRAFGRLMRLGVDFYDRELPGRVAARVVHDLDQIAAFLETGVYELARSIALLIASFVVIGLWEPSVALAVAGALPILAILTALQLKPADRAYNDARAALGDVVARLQEDFAGRRVIESLGAEERSRDEFVRLAFRLREARKRANTIGNVYIELMQLVGALAGVALLNTAAHRVFDGSLSVGGMVALQLFLTAALAPIPALSAVLQRYLAARASFRTLGQPFAAPVRPQPRPQTAECPSASGDVVLTGVTFAYPDTTRQVLHDVDLTVPAGTTVAVVGPTGAGKSSIAKLVARVYDVDGGGVTVGGTDVRDWDLASYRRRIGIVPQDGFCFRGTVAENIAYGRPDATRQDIEEAAAAVGALDAVLGLVGGLDARVEEEGRNLTAAQVQLIALARAWLTKPDLLILDEATSSLDPETEQHVLKATRAMDRTTIMITHRLPVAQSADLVVVVADGAVAETGKPSTLKRRRTGAYAALWKSGPEVDARVAGTELPDANVVATNGHVVKAVLEHPMIDAAIRDLRTGALGAGLHSTNDAAPTNANGSAATAALAGKVIGETDEELVAFLAAAGGVEVVAHSILDALRSAVDPAAAGAIAVAFEVDDHRWVLVSDPDASSATLATVGEAALTLRLDGPDLLRLAIGQLDPIEGVMTGRLALTGDLEQVARLGELFSSAPALAGV